jgi:anthranilate synthase component 1
MARIEGIYPDLKEFKRLSRQGNLVPVYKEISADLETPVSTFIKLAAKESYAYLLESAEGGERWGRYSFISWDPYRIFESKKDQYLYAAPERQKGWKTTSDPLNELKDAMAEFKPVSIPGLPRFWGGAVGYVSYDTVRFFEKLPVPPHDDLELPDALFLLTDKLVIFDHLTHSVKIVVCVHLSKGVDIERSYRQAEQEIDAVIKLLRKPLNVQKKRTFAAGPLLSNLKKEQFQRNVNTAKEHIRAGDIIQVVLSQRFMRKTSVSSFDIYRSLRLLNPSPYMYFIKAGDFDIIGSSPEILVRKEGSLVETRPIAGTRPRGANEKEEEILARELVNDPKERAEHIMLVDLGRNDIGRVCESGSVSVSNLMSVEKYSHVMHMVSSVTGKLNPGMDSFEVFRACFPAGTVSSAPKVRAMEIIDELEPTARGPYAGSVGYFSYSGNMDMAITIRTIVLKDKKAYCQAGAGIVADSVPEKEFQETKNKAAALFSAIDKAEQNFGD